MTKKEIYFIILFPLCYLMLVLTPVWLVAMDVFPSGFLDVTGFLFYILFAVGSFTVPSVSMFFHQKRKQAGILTHCQKIGFVASSAVLFALFGTYAFLTFLLPLLVDYPASCCPGCPSAYVCWAGLPMPETLFTVLIVGFTILSGLSLPFFILWMSMLWRENKRKKRMENHP